MTDIRWKQRLENLTKSLVHLEDAVSVSNASLLQKAGTIQFFVMSFELSWKTLKDYLEEQGFTDVKSPRASIKKSFEIELIVDGHIWLEALENRNLAAHTYNEETANEFYNLICHSYYPLLKTLHIKLEELSHE